MRSQRRSSHSSTPSDSGPRPQVSFSATNLRSRRAACRWRLVSRSTVQGRIRCPYWLSTWSRPRSSRLARSNTTSSLSGSDNRTSRSTKNQRRLTRVLERQVRRCERVHKRRDDSRCWPSRTSSSGRRRCTAGWRRAGTQARKAVVRIASEQEQRADEISADDRADQVGDLLASKRSRAESWEGRSCLRECARSVRPLCACQECSMAE